MFKLSSVSTGTFLVGEVAENEVANASVLFTDTDGLVYSTLFNAVDDLSTLNINESSVYYSEGAIEIEEINTTKVYVSGTFWFTAYNDSGVENVNFNQGVFYQVSFVTE